MVGYHPGKGFTGQVESLDPLEKTAVQEDVLYQDRPAVSQRKP